MASSEETNHVYPTAPLEEEKLVRHMSYEALLRLSQLLRPHHELGNNYTALAGQLGFTFEEITDLREERDPVHVMLNKPELRDLTISRLKSCLMAIDRLDALQELETFEEKTLYPSEYRQRQAERHGRNNDQQFTVLSNDEKYDAFICYARQDIGFAKEILKRLESEPYHLKLCIDYRDILPGGGNLSTVAHIIEERCQKIVVILSEFFNNDESADFQAKIALSLSPGCKNKRLIPIKYEQCKIPTIYRFITHLDYTNENAREYLWPNLARALGYAPR
ncbi:myeloid differentiation primary response protein MyD88-like [Actinia tenebrosa]|uniref:Myeloid differentiation primary response protein MyD88-like n=1 Tax=Actinia tenebrosa TaxID=6105 RepID=A0A6P8HLB3_ACTTE|nr:myeloid differentiation primary response protein MyD88-like [Actinia tenebrosa]